jgi:hypothetical protein
VVPESQIEFSRQTERTYLLLGVAKNGNVAMAYVIDKAAGNTQIQLTLEELHWLVFEQGPTIYRELKAMVE